MRKMTTEEFIRRAQEIHGDKYDYSLVKYITAHIKVKIICKKHNKIFEQKPYSQLQGVGCPICGKIQKAESRKNTIVFFVQKARKEHGLKFDYSKVVFINMNTKVCIICSEHGEFWQTPHDHIGGHGCRKCTKYAKNNHEWFLTEAYKVHDCFYSYPEEYKGSKIKIDILCPIHGLFKQSPENHLKGHRHPNHAIITSKPEIEIKEMIEGLGFKTESNKRKYIKPYEIDIFIPELNKAIEFNGKYWHYSEKFFRPGYHAMKSNLCKDIGVKLLHVREDLWIKNKKHMKKVIIKFLNL